MRVNLIYAFRQQGKSQQIGLNGSLPWQCKQDMDFYKDMTRNKTLLMGYNTFKDAYRTLEKQPKNVHLVNNLQDIQTVIQKNNSKEIFICGGKKIYEIVMKEMPHLIQNIYQNEIKQSIKQNPNDHVVSLDDFQSKINSNFYLTQQIQTDEVIFNKYTGFCNELNYIRLVNDVIQFGDKTQTRNGITRSLNGKNLKIKVHNNSLPLFTHRKMFFRGMFEEAMWFIRGQTDVKILQDKNINFWNGNISNEYVQSQKYRLDEEFLLNRQSTDLGEVYGHNLRQFNGNIDQLNDAIKLLEKEPNSRRNLIVLFNPSSLNKSLIPPCHSCIIQLQIRTGFLDMQVYNRSSDLILGLPFNITWQSLLMHFICKRLQLNTGILDISIGNAHVYEEHVSNFKGAEYEYKIKKEPVIHFKQVHQDISRYQFKDVKIDYEYNENTKQDVYVMKI